jgi:ribonuclease HI
MKMPIWKHIKYETRTQISLRLNGPQERCLQENHKIKTVGDMLNMMARLLFANHRNKRNCACSSCKEDWNKGCTHPHKCTVQGNKYINIISSKWDPRQIPEDQTPLLINSRSSHLTQTSKVFRVFWKKEERTPRTIRDLEDDLRMTPRTDHPQITAYTDRSCSRTASNEAKAGCGVWFGDEDERNIALHMPKRFATNNAAELTAIIAAVSQANPTADLNIISDSSYVINGLTKYMRNWEDIRGIDIKNHEPFIVAITALHSEWLLMDQGGGGMRCDDEVGVGLNKVNSGK